MKKINMNQVLKNQPKRYYVSQGYVSGERLFIALIDHIKDISGDKFVNVGDYIMESTGNNWKESEDDNYDKVIKINKTYALYTNNGYSVVKKYKKGSL
jgi:hypothetical protein